MLSRSRGSRRREEHARRADGSRGARARAFLSGNPSRRLSLLSSHAEDSRLPERAIFGGNGVAARQLRLVTQPSWRTKVRPLDVLTAT